MCTCEKQIDLEKDETVFVNLPDGSNLALSFKKGYENVVEVNIYTSNKKGQARLAPAILMTNSNTFGIEFRREGTEEKE